MGGVRDNAVGPALTSEPAPRGGPRDAEGPLPDALGSLVADRKAAASGTAGNCGDGEAPRTCKENVNTGGLG